MASRPSGILICSYRRSEAPKRGLPALFLIEHSLMPATALATSFNGACQSVIFMSSRLAHSIASAPCGEQLWRAALSQPSPKALCARRPLGCWGGLRRGWATQASGPAQRASIHLSPVTEVCLLRRPRRRKGGCPRLSRASALSHWRGNLGHGSLWPTTRELVDSWELWGAGSYKDLGGLGKLRRCANPPLCTRFLSSHVWPFHLQVSGTWVPVRSGDCPGCRGGGKGAK